ncbi:Transcriptional regulator, IclR family [Cupriavidus basilensis]|uniref:Transcriptional regulator, IclR family n=1 Tax=Cupriavidus basilensis TaxID=68895 RepID=A0A0C4YA99_9BURK|nr:Transcriptional regulator, IclR family [Cupriavidus basilensis]
MTRLLQSLVALGYLHLDEVRRKYRLAAASLALGYAAIADSAVQREASVEMRRVAEATDTYVVLGTGDRLDVIVLDSRVGSRARTYPPVPRPARRTGQIRTTQRWCRSTRPRLPATSGWLRRARGRWLSPF